MSRMEHAVEALLEQDRAGALYDLPAASLGQLAVCRPPAKLLVGDALAHLRELPRGGFVVRGVLLVYCSAHVTLFQERCGGLHAFGKSA